jgi:type I restriction enzyme, S subunit
MIVFSPLNKQEKMIISAILSRISFIIVSIVGTIGTIDDLIENLQSQKNKLVGIIAQKFNSYEGALKIEFGSVFAGTNGAAYQSQKYVESGEWRLVTIKNISDNGFDASNVSFIRDEDVVPNTKLRKGDLLLTLTGNVGRVGIVDRYHCLLNQRVLKLESPSMAYLLGYCLKYRSEMEILANGAAQKNLGTGNLYKLPVHNTKEEIGDFAKFDFLYKHILLLKEKILSLQECKTNLLEKYF